MQTKYLARSSNNKKRNYKHQKNILGPTWSTVIQVYNLRERLSHEVLSSPGAPGNTAVKWMRCAALEGRQWFRWDKEKWWNALMAATTGTSKLLGTLQRPASIIVYTHSQEMNPAEPHYFNIFPCWHETFFHYQVISELSSPEDTVSLSCTDQSIS